MKTLNKPTMCLSGKTPSAPSVTVLVFAGDLRFNPLTDTLIGADGKPFKFLNPTGHELSPYSYDHGENMFQAPPKDRASVQVAVSPTSDRLQLLKPFKLWDRKTPEDLPVLTEVKEKCSMFKFLSNLRSHADSFFSY